MRLQRFSPAAPLADVIDAVWVAEVPEPPRLTILPGTSPVACFQFGGAVTSGQGAERRVTRSGMTGMQNQAQEYGADNTLRAVMVRFTPWGAATILRESLDAFYNRHFDLADILPAHLIRTVEAQLHDATTAPDRLWIVQRFLLGQRNAASWDPLIRNAVDNIRKHEGQVQVKALARDYLISERQLERRFRQIIGTSPKQFSRIVRFQAAIRYGARGLSWAAVAQQTGYSDQSHLIKEFQALAGHSPESLLSQPPSMLAQHFNNHPGTSGFYNTVFL
ncbi:helix-turn-helix transcriptional regulator [bacterium]|nr:helix-turn-helix transcriptional regulator [bacterium]